MSDDGELHAAWIDIMEPGRRSAEWFDDLVGRHRQAHRRYHGLRHVVWVLRHVRELSTQIPECHDESFDLAAVTAAAFFHDAIYDATASDNEERSAQLADQALESLGWAERRRRVAAELIRATTGHIGEIARSNVATALEYGVLLDADLAVLGSDPASYSAYAAGVRVEYSHVSDQDWVSGRSAVLRRLIARPMLYETDPGRHWWEQTARANLAAELAALSCGG